ncbi:MAG: PIF1 family DEAD/DEAH box helicase [Candidatus Moranbacteria bacterium]|nr:PIF1 family DEAD/DEAH box helicase [Candidatus Moranbacteria bacterium]
MNQKTALEILKMGYNVFLTGPAGSGKTFLLNQYIEYLKSKGVPMAITASTGIAATHLNGKTIHSWSGLGIRESLDEKSLNRISHKRQLKSRILKTKTLIIDEISMLHADQLDAVDEICKHVRESQLPFGGIQTIFCGDFFQLPPIQRENQRETSFAYASGVWSEMDIKVCYLDEQHRQKDSALTRVLNDIRQNSVDNKTREIVDSCRDKIFFGNMQPTKLFTHNVDVDHINEQELKKIPRKAFAYNMRSFGKIKLVEFLRKSCLAPEKLTLKNGARVMFVKNNFEEGYVNGTMGQVIGFEAETKMPIIKTIQDKIITAQPSTWVMEEDEEVIASIKQLPLRLAWAITVHKSQGMSLDAAEIDLSKSFEYGMGYVALSRVRTLLGLSVLGVNEIAFQVHANACEKDREFIRLSDNALREICKISDLEKNRKQKMFIGEKGDNQNQSKQQHPQSANAYIVDEIRKKFTKAYMPWTKENDKLLEKFFDQDKSIRELAEIFERKEGAIRSRLKKIGAVKDT